MKHINVLAAAIALSMSFAASNVVAAEAHAAKEKVVLQVSDADPAKWNLALNNVKNVQQAIGADKVEAEIVVYGPGIGMLKSDSVVANRIEEAKAAGVTIVACGTTMKGMKLTDADMLPHTSYVPAGVVELMHKQSAGYSYIRP
jgi:uncharacterized protein